MYIFPNGSAVEHKVKIPGSLCKFSVWYDRDGYPTDAARIDRLSRSYGATPAQWAYLMRYRPVVLTPAGGFNPLNHRS